jgi:hypothetical protein
MIFMTIKDGRLQMKENGTVLLSANPLKDDEMDIIARAMVKRGEIGYLHSSSLDFPEEEGFPREIDFHEIIENAILRVS